MVEHPPSDTEPRPAKLAGQDHKSDFNMVYVGLDRLDPAHDDLEGQLSRTLAESGVWDDESRAVPDALRRTVSELEHRVNQRYVSVLRDAPELSLELRPVAEWFTGKAIAWKFGPAALPLSAMSKAQRFWADWAIGVAIHEHMYAAWPGLPPTLLLIDEPEAALHRAAESQMARALQSFALESGRQVVVASHSPELIDLPEATVLEVRRIPGSDRSGVSPLESVDHEALEALGLHPSDLLRRQRGFLLVEGVHDEALLRTWIGRELDALRVEILPLHGGAKLPATIESRVLFDFTDAHLFVILDATDALEVQSAWRDAELRFLADGPAAAGDELRARLGRKPAEREWLGNWLTRALQRGRRERVTPHGLHKADIIEYLPVALLVPRAHSWEQLRQVHAPVAETRPQMKDFKTWLAAKKKANLDVPTLKQAAMDAPVPDEVLTFLELVTETLNGPDSHPPRGT